MKSKSCLKKEKFKLYGGCIHIKGDNFAGVLKEMCG